MAANLLSNNISSPSGSTTGNRTVDAADQVSTQVRNQQMRAPMENVAIFWDIENCAVPAEVRVEDVASNIRTALRLCPVIKGPVTSFSAYGDFRHFPPKFREGCQRTGVNLIDVPGEKKDAADKAILVDMFLFAIDNPSPSTILLISGDVDFAPGLHKLGQRGYTVLLAIPSGVGVSSALRNAGKFVWYWPNLASGGSDPLGCFSSEASGVSNNEEIIVYKGMPQNRYIVGTSSTQTYTFNSTHIAADLSRIQFAGPSSQPSAAISRGFNSFARTSSTPINVSKSLPGSHFTDAGSSGTPSDTSPAPNSTPWVQPGDSQGLKGQLLKLVNTSEGRLLLDRVPAEYNREFGGHLVVAEYGSRKMVDLIKKMSDTFCIEGEGHSKFLCLKESATASGAISPCNTSSSDVVSRESRAMKTKMSKKVQEPYSDSDAYNNLLLESAEEYSVESNAVSYSDEGSVGESAVVCVRKPEGDQQPGKTNLEKKTRGAGGEDFTENIFPKIGQGTKTTGRKKPSHPDRGKGSKGRGRGHQFEGQEPRSEAPVGQRHERRTMKQVVQEAKKAKNEGTDAEIRRRNQEMEANALQEDSETEMEDWGNLIPDPGNTRSPLSLYVYRIIKRIMAKAMEQVEMEITGSGRPKSTETQIYGEK